jgi:di/tricarboxylate transporter
MGWEAWLTLAVVVAVLTALVRNVAEPDVLLCTAVTFLVVAGEVSGSQHLPSISSAVAGLGNTGIATVGVLFIVVAGLTQTGAMQRLVGPLVGNPKSATGAQLRLLLPVSSLSAFLNNTPVVAMFLPVVDGLSKRTKVPASQLYLPMAYAATFGGVCTLIGTSTNLIVNGLWTKETGGPGLAMFDLAWIGIPAAVTGIGLMLWLAPRLLRSRRPAIEADENRREYFVEMTVVEGGPLVGITIEAAGLRHLDRLFLVEIERNGEVLPAVSPQQRLMGGDRLAFVGEVASVVELNRIAGLAPLDRLGQEAKKGRRMLIEAVVSDRCALRGETIREGRFRSVYNAAIVAMARGAERMTGKLGDVELQPGDTLLLEAGEDFMDRYRYSSDFFLVSRVENSELTRNSRAWVALLLLVGMVFTATMGWCDLLTAACLTSVLMVATGCCSVSQARSSIDWSLLVAIAASLGLGEALKVSGLADTFAENMLQLACGSPWGSLLGIYCTTMILTELITNNAAAVLAYPLAISTANSLGVSQTPFIITIMVAASAGFATPFGYQTNLMVYGPGGYRFSDYIKIGVPLDLAYLVVTVALVPVFFPFGV